jgi:hypothetical protein
MSHPDDQATESAERARSRRPGGLLGWLFNPRQRRFLLPATGAWILLLDWVLFSSNLLSAWLATPAVMAVGFVLGSIGTFFAQRRKARDATWLAALKAVLAGIVVGLPWPVGGTLVGGWVLLTSGLGDAGKAVKGR